MQQILIGIAPVLPRPRLCKQKREKCFVKACHRHPRAPPARAYYDMLAMLLFSPLMLLVLFRCWFITYTLPIGSNPVNSNAFMALSPYRRAHFLKRPCRTSSLPSCYAQPAPAIKPHGAAALDILLSVSPAFAPTVGIMLMAATARRLYEYLFSETICLLILLARMP